MALIVLSLHACAQVCVDVRADGTLVKGDWFGSVCSNACVL